MGAQRWVGTRRVDQPVGCGDACPIYPGRRYLNWDLPDPAEFSMNGVRAVRDDIDARVRALLVEIDSMNVA